MKEIRKFVCIVPAAAVRKKPSHKTEIVNQLLFGETMHALREKNKWLLIQSLHDNYEGWIRSNQVMCLEEKGDNAGSRFVTAGLVNTITVGGEKMNLPAGASLFGFSNGQGHIESLDYEFSGETIDRADMKPGQPSLVALVMPWLNAPYLWGGRTIFGVDCSGFAQIIFKMLGLDLLRDAKQQARQGVEVENISDASCGDLAFFHNRSKKIVHVGIMLDNKRIIHASGKVRIDSIDKKGIIHRDTGKYSHRLSCIRRYW
jgi:cell wall-associated NlpC family hydrolase